MDLAAKTSFEGFFDGWKEDVQLEEQDLERRWQKCKTPGKNLEVNVASLCFEIGAGDICSSPTPKTHGLTARLSECEIQPQNIWSSVGSVHVGSLVGDIEYLWK